MSRSTRSPTSLTTDATRTSEDGPRSPTDVLANDTFEGAAVASTARRPSGAHGSVVTQRPGRHRHLHRRTPTYNGTDSAYTYTVTSGGVTETATVNVTIDPVADIADDSDSTNEDTAVTTNVLANDTSRTPARPSRP